MSKTNSTGSSSSTIYNDMPGKGDNDFVSYLSVVFSKLATWSFDHRVFVLIFCLALLATGAYFASTTRVDSSFDAYFNPSEPAYLNYNEYRKDFGSDEIAYIMYKAPAGVEHGVFNLKLMHTIAGLTETLENEVPFTKEVISLSNVEFIEGDAGGISAKSLLADFNNTQEELLVIRDKLLKKDIYIGYLVDKTASYGALMLKSELASSDSVDDLRLDPEGGDGLDNLYPQVSNTKIVEILARPEYAGITFYNTGNISLNSVFNSTIQGESITLGAKVFAAIGFMLMLFFRFSVIGVLGPLAIALVSIFLSVAFIAVMGWKIDQIFVFLPIFLTVVGVADSVHIISEYRLFLAKLGDRREALRRTMLLVGPACLLTSVTTATGFLAMSVSPIKTFEHMSIYTAFGVMAAFLLSITLLPYFLSYSRIPKHHLVSEQDLENAPLPRMLRAIAQFVITFRVAIIVVFTTIVIFAGIGISRIEVDSNFMLQFSEKMDIRKDNKAVNDVMGGTGAFIYIFDTANEGGIKEPAVLREIEKLQREADRHDDIVDKTTSIVDLLKDINQSFHGGDPAYHVIPESRALVAQYLLIYEMSGGDDLESYVSGDYSRANLKIRVSIAGTRRLGELVSSLDDYMAEHPVELSSVSVTGVPALWLKLVEYIVESQINGVLLAFSAIAVLMCIIFQSVKIGLLSMVPNIFPVVITLGMMGWMGITLDHSRSLIATIAIGIAVDDTIHLVTRYHLEFKRCRNYQQAFVRSLSSVGRALVITSFVIIVGFLMYPLSVMDSTTYMGLLLAFTIIVALIGDFLLMPALILVLKPFGKEEEMAQDSAVELDAVQCQLSK